MGITRKKQIGIVAAVSLFAALLFVVIGLVTRDLQAISGLPGILAALLALVWAAAAACAYAFLADWRAGAYIMSTVAAVAVAAAGLLSASAVIGALLMFLFLTLAAHFIAHSSRNRISFHVVHTILPGLRLLIMGLAVATVAMLLPLVRQQINDGKIFIPIDSIQLALRPAAPLLNTFISDYHADSTVGDLIDNQIRRQEQELPPGFVIDPNARELALRDLERRLGVSLTGSETLADILAGVSNQQVRALAERGGGLTVTIALITIGLIAIRAIVPVLAWPALLMATGLFFLARQSGLVRVVKQEMPVDRLQL